VLRKKRNPRKNGINKDWRLSVLRMGTIESLDQIETVIAITAICSLSVVATVLCIAIFVAFLCILPSLCDSKTSCIAMCFHNHEIHRNNWQSTKDWICYYKCKQSPRYRITICRLLGGCAFILEAPAVKLLQFVIECLSDNSQIAPVDEDTPTDFVSAIMYPRHPAPPMQPWMASEFADVYITIA
jgi:hypothetical protein